MIRGAYIFIHAVLATTFLGLATIASTYLFRSSRMAFGCRRAWARWLLGVTGVRVETVSLRQDPLPQGAFVVAANHASFLDVLALIVAFPGTGYFIAKKELQRIPLFGSAAKAGGVIFIDRFERRGHRKSLARIQGVVEQGGAILVFPEGTRTPDGLLKPFRPGAFSIAVRSKIPIVPVVIRGTFSLMPRQRRFGIPGKVRVEILNSIEIPDADGSQQKSLLAEETRRAIEAQLKKS